MEQFIDANGVRLCAESFGGGPAVLLIHGAGNSMVSWDDAFCARLAEDRRVLRYDARDAGRSVASTPGAPDYGLRDLVEDAAGVLDAFGVEVAHVVGLSMGAAIAQLLALDHPSRVATLTLLASTPGLPGSEQPDLPSADPALFAAEPSPPDWTDREAVIEYIVAAERPYSAAFDEPAMRALAARVFDRAEDIAANLTNHFIQDPGPPWRRRLRDIAAPTLVLHGRHDPSFPLAHGTALAREIPGARLVVLEGVGHEYPPRQAWDVVLASIREHTSAGAHPAATPEKFRVGP